MDAPEGQPGRASPEWAEKKFHDVDRYEMAAWVPLIVLIVVVGVYPKLVLGATTDAVVGLVETAFRAAIGG